MSNQGVIKILIITAITLGSSHTALAYQAGNYPDLAEIRAGSQTSSLNMSNHPIANAIEQSSAIPLLSHSALQTDWSLIVPQQQFSSDYLYRRLTPASLLQAITPVIRDFVCAEYRFRHRQLQSSHCNNTNNPNSAVEGMPFVSGLFTNRDATYDYEDQNNRISYQATLPSASRHALQVLEGSVHELGTFFGGFASNNSLILNMRVNMYTLDKDGFRKSQLNRSAISLWIILPPAIEISRQSHQVQAANYALQEAKLLILGKQAVW